MGKPDELAGLVVYLASDAATYNSNTIIELAGEY